MTGMLRKMVVAAAVIAAVAFGQQAIRVSELQTLDRLLLGEMVKGAGWNLAYRGGPAKYAPVDADVVADSLRVGVVEAITDANERALIWHYREEAIEALSWLTLVGGHLAGFLSPDLGAVRYFQQDGQLGVLISGLSIEAEFNTFTTTELERARRVVYEMLVPTIRWVGRAFEGTQVKWVGISLSYGTRDFTASFAWGTPEQTLVLFPMAALMEFDRAAITDVTLVQRSIVFSGDAALRRIDLGR